jgi:hypothetical protein
VVTHKGFEIDTTREHNEASERPTDRRSMAETRIESCERKNLRKSETHRNPPWPVFLYCVFVFKLILKHNVGASDHEDAFDVGRE